MLDPDFEVRRIREIDGGNLVRITHAGAVFWAIKATGSGELEHAVVLLGPHEGRIKSPCLLAMRGEDTVAMDYGKSFTLDLESLAEPALLSPQEFHRCRGAVIMNAAVHAIRVPEIVGFTMLDSHYIELRNGALVPRPDLHAAVVFPAWSLSRFRAIGDLVMRRDLLTWDGRRSPDV